MRILLLIFTMPATLLHAVLIRAHSTPRKANRFYPHGYMREEVDALRRVKPRR